MKGYNIYNLGESSVINLNTVVSTIENALDKKAIIDYLPLQEGDVNITYADISKAKQEICYNPKYEFQKGIEEFVKWYKMNKNYLY